MPGTPLRLVVGLGNPGPTYDRTRHNAGFDFVEELARRAGTGFKRESRHQGEVARARLAGQELWLLKPMTYMNLSGGPVQSLAGFHKIGSETILVAHDELDFPPGVARLKQGGGAGGHNGLRDVMARLGENFWRLRIGIGHPGDRSTVLDYVLGRPPQAEAGLIRAAMSAAADVIPIMLLEGAEKAMNRLHRRSNAEPPARPA